MSTPPLPQSGGRYTRDAESGALQLADHPAPKRSGKGKPAPKSEEK